MAELNSLVMCAWCKRVKPGNEWIKETSPNYEFITSSYGNKITHGICREDGEKYFKEYSYPTHL